MGLAFAAVLEKIPHGRIFQPVCNLGQHANGHGANDFVFMLDFYPVEEVLLLLITKGGSRPAHRPASGHARITNTIVASEGADNAEQLAKHPLRALLLALLPVSSDA